MAWCSSASPIINGQPGGSGGSPSVPGAEGYEIAQSINFITQSTAAIADGAVAFTALYGAPVWTAAASAAAGTWRTLNGTGLQFSAAAVNTQYVSAGGGQTATNLTTPWATLVPSYDPSRRYMLQIVTSVNDGNAINERVMIGVFRPAGVPTGASNALSAAFRGHNGTAVLGGMLAANSLGLGSVDYAASNVVCWMSNPSSPSGAAAFMGTAVGGDFPAMSTLRTAGFTFNTAAPSAVTDPIFTDPQATVVLAFPTGNNSATFNVTVTRLRVLVAA